MSDRRRYHAPRRRRNSFGSALRVCLREKSATARAVSEPGHPNSFRRQALRKATWGLLGQGTIYAPQPKQSRCEARPREEPVGPAAEPGRSERLRPTPRPLWFRPTRGAPLAENTTRESCWDGQEGRPRFAGTGPRADPPTPRRTIGRQFSAERPGCLQRPLGAKDRAGGVAQAAPLLPKPRWPAP